MGIAEEGVFDMGMGSRPTGSRLLAVMVLAASLLLSAIVLAACQPPVAPQTPTARPPAAEQPAVTQGQMAPSAQSALRESWEKSKHANTYVLEDGNNNDCARCHSPQNWVPTDAADMPATCASCKFKTPSPKPVSKADWQSVGCDICHKVEKGTASPQIVWLNALVAQYEPSRDPYETVTTPTELCEKCHADIKGWNYRRDLGRNAHMGKGCTDCHDAHSLKASCTATCHASVLKPDKPVPGHDAAHAAVKCGACHDASGLKVGPTDDKKTWLTFRSTDPRGKPGTRPYVSHSLQRKVDCARCHYAGNPWGLKTNTS